MGEFVDGQFEDAEVDSVEELKESGSKDASSENKEIKDCVESDENDWQEGDEEDDEDDDQTLQSVEWKYRSSNVTKQYHQAIGKISAGTNPQNPSGKGYENLIKKFQSRVNLGAYEPPRSMSFRKTDEHFSKRKDKSDQATLDKALDKKTMMILFKLLNRYFTDIEGCVSTGKEANVYYATSKDGRGLAVKVFKTVGSEFRNRNQYMAGEHRFQYNTCTKDIRKLVPKWAEKEYRNLHRIYKAGIPSPEPIHLDGNILVMEFVGEDGRAAPKLKDVQITSEEADCFYVDCIKMMRTMFQTCKLIHADLSEFNMLVFNGKLYIIDVSQSVEMDNENSIKFLQMDIRNVTAYFRKQGVMTLPYVKLLEFIVKEEINVDEFLKDALNEAKTSNGDNDDDKDMEEAVVLRTFNQENCFGAGDTACVTFSADGCEMEASKILDKVHVSFKFDNPRNDDIDENDNGDDKENIDSDDDSDEECENITNDHHERIDSKSKIKEDQIKYYRPREESPNSKKERKNVIKEIQKANRQKKRPKAEKKRLIKISKTKK